MLLRFLQTPENLGISESTRGTRNDGSESVRSAEECETCKAWAEGGAQRQDGTVEEERGGEEGAGRVSEDADLLEV